MPRLGRRSLCLLSAIGSFRDDLAQLALALHVEQLVGEEVADLHRDLITRSPRMQGHRGLRLEEVGVLVLLDLAAAFVLLPQRATTRVA